MKHLLCWPSWFFAFSTAATKNPFFATGEKVFYAIISVFSSLGGKSYIRTLDTMFFFLGYSKEKNGVRGTKLLFPPRGGPSDGEIIRGGGGSA